MAQRRARRPSWTASMEEIHPSNTTSSSIPSRLQQIFVFQRAFNEQPQPQAAAPPHTFIIMPSLFRQRRGTDRKMVITNAMAEPGRPISKAERDARKDSVLNVQEEQHSQEYEEEPRQKKEHGHDYCHPVLLPTFKDEFAPRSGRQPVSTIRILDLAYLVVLFLLAFGVLWVILEHILINIRVSAQCTPSTVYIPVTETVTSTQSCSVLSSSVAAPVASSSSTLALTTILTTTVPYTQTVTILATLSSSSSASISGQSSAQAPLSFMVDNGTTSWLGASPSSGVSVVIASTVATLSVVPVPPSAITELTSHITMTTTVVITKSTAVTLSSHASTTSLSTNLAVASSQITPTAIVPPFTSTIFSMVSPNSTTTITRTRYTTISLSRVTPHSSFTGIQSNGWNSTSAVEYAQSAQPTTRTFSEIYYFGTGTATTSTSTLLITTTIGATITQTFVPTPFVASVSGTLTTITGTPATITYTVQADQPASTISIPGATSSVFTSSNAAGQSVALPSALSSATILSSSQVRPSGSSSASLMSTGFSSRATTVPMLSSLVGPTHSNTSSSVSGQAANFPSAITVTSFISGQGTTFVVMSTPVATIPTSPLSSDTNLPSPSTWKISSSTTSGGAGLPPAYSMVESSVQSTRGSSSTVRSTRTNSSATGPASAAYGQTTSIALTSEFTTISSGSTTIVAILSSKLSGSSSTSRSSTTSKSAAASNSSSKPASSSATRTSSSSFSNPFAASSATATPSQGCGEQGDFTMTFDDLPKYSPSKRQWNATNATDITQYPPLNQRPYHHLLFSNGYVYAPNPAEPFAPASSPNVAAFVEPNVLKSTPGSMPNQTEPGEIGDDPRGDDKPAFYFDAQDAYLGCDNDGPDDCTVEATGYKYDPRAKDSVPGPQQNYTLAPCIGYKNCKLQQVDFPSTFSNLSGIQFRAFVDSKPRMYFLDNLHMRWSNTSCSAGMERQSSR